MNCKNPAKRLWLAAAAALWLGVLSVHADALQDGQAAFKKGDYAGAARAFETALSTKGPSAGLYYDLGMAQLKDGHRPEATLSFHRALLLDPRLADAQVALSDLERSQGVPVASNDWRDKVAEKVPLAALAVTGTVLAWLGAFLLLRAFFKRGPRFGAVLGAIAVLLIGKGLAFAGCFADPRLTDRQAAVVLGTESVNLLASADDQATSVAKLPPGATLKILGHSGDWTKCETAAGDQGWTTSKALAPVVPKA